MAENLLGESFGDTFGGMIPSLTSSQVMTWVIIIGGIFIFAGFLGFLTYYFWIKFRYNKKIIVFKKVGTEIIPVMEDKGWLTRVGGAGDTWMKTKSSKKTLPRPKIQMRKNEYWYYEREDGEWINFNLKDFDLEMKKAGISYVDEDMRLQRLGIQKNLEARFQQVSFWQKYGGMIMSLIFILVITVCFVILFKEMKDNWTVGKEMASAVKDMAEQVRNMRVSVGSGIQPIQYVLPLIRGVG